MLHFVVAVQTMLREIPDAVNHRIRREDGAIGIEYAIVAVVISLGIVAAAFAARNQIRLMLSQIVAAQLTDT
jgi:Flp pilus assembly pilin Flp